MSRPAAGFRPFSARHRLAGAGLAAWLSLAGLLAVGLPGAASAIVLPDASYYLVCAGDIAEGAVPISLPCDDTTATTGDPPNWETSSAGVAEAYAGIPEFDPGLPADLIETLETELGDERFVLLTSVQVESNVEITEADPESEFGVSANAAGYAALRFAAGVEQIASPPIPIEEIPVRLRVLGEIRIEGGSGGSGYGQIVVGSTLGSLEWEQIGNGSKPVDVVIDTEFFWVGDAYIFDKSVQCSVSTAEVPQNTLGASATADCLAVLDPIVELDQARFDLLYGASSFPLEEYYEIVYSPNLPIPPEGPGVPALIDPLAFFTLDALLVLGGAWMAGPGRRRVR